MTRFHKFFAASFLTLITGASALAGEMSTPRTATTAANVASTSIDAATEALVIVIQSLLPVL